MHLPFALNADDVRLYYVDATPDKTTASAEAMLNAAEIARANRFVKPAMRRVFILAHAMLRDVLGQHLDMDPKTIVFRSHPHGKPYLGSANPYDLQFNLSHSDDIAICAIARNRQIGVDIEKISPKPSLLQVAERFFAPEECAALNTCSAHDVPELFTQIWTRKEAYIKALGTGLRHPLDAFSVMPSLRTPSGSALISQNTEINQTWFCHGLTAPLSYAAALATSFKSPHISQHIWVTPE